MKVIELTKELSDVVDAFENAHKVQYDRLTLSEKLEIDRNAVRLLLLSGHTPMEVWRAFRDLVSNDERYELIAKYVAEFVSDGKK